MPRKLTAIEAFSRIKAKHPSIEILSSEYVDAHKLLKCLCKTCKYKWQASYYSLFSRNSGCANCAKNAKLDTGKAFNRIKEKHPSIKILSDRYTNYQTHLTLRCEKGHIWQATYSNLVNCNSGCPRCSKIEYGLKKKFSTVEAFNRIKEKHPNIKILSDSYANCATHLKLQCEKGHIWQATYDKLVNSGTGCPKCKRKMTKGEKMIFDLLISCGLTYRERT